MRLPKTARALIAVALAGTGLLTGNLASSGLAQPAPPDPIQAWRSAAARLLAEMRPNTPIDTQVARLIDRLATGDHEQVQVAVTALTMLGRPAVPAIIGRMDDRREMKVRGVAFVNDSPNSFEGLRHYGVEKVVDCLDDVLNDITGESFGMIDTGDGPRGPDPALWRKREAQRTAVVAGWRGYLGRSRATPRPPGKSLPVPG